MREELAKLRVEINEDKSRMVDLAKGEKFSFLGFEYRRIRSRNRVWRPYYAPTLKKRTALFAKLRVVFRRNVSQPVGKVIEKINPILRGWVNHFRVGDSSRCFSMVKRWVEKKVRRHLMRASKRKGMGWIEGNCAPPHTAPPREIGSRRVIKVERTGQERLEAPSCRA